jgi:transcriptional regulator with XRE-family HTH domain
LRLSLGQALAKKLRVFRAIKGFTQQELADQLGITRVTVNRWETKGADNASLAELERISVITGETVQELLELPGGNLEAALARLGNLSHLGPKLLARLSTVNDEEQIAGLLRWFESEDRVNAEFRAKALLAKKKPKAGNSG